jgi:hypothetical protein
VFFLFWLKIRQGRKGHDLSTYFFQEAVRWFSLGDFPEFTVVLKLSSFFDHDPSLAEAILPLTEVPLVMPLMLECSSEPVAWYLNALKFLNDPEMKKEDMKKSADAGCSYGLWGYAQYFLKDDEEKYLVKRLYLFDLFIFSSVFSAGADGGGRSKGELWRSTRIRRVLYSS